MTDIVIEPADKEKIISLKPNVGISDIKVKHNYKQQRPAQQMQYNKSIMF